MSLPTLPKLQLTRCCWREPLLTLALAAGFALLPLGSPAARAVILPAQTIDGPSEDIVGFGGVAMAEDGTGGLVYVKRVEGVPHVFVSRYVEGRWQAPIRVDYEQPFAGSSPRIGAAGGGELVVVWATPFATESEKPVYELLASLLGPGGSRFGQATIVDGDVREAVGVSPDLAMSSTGQADVVYRVVENGPSSIPLLRPGDVVEQVRVAHFDGRRWVGLGAINRNLGSSMRPPSATNAPQIAIGPTGNGVVVWQEPDVEGVARIWARRVFGPSLDYVMAASATSFKGAPIAADADAPAVAFSALGQAELAYRQPAGPGSPLPGPRIFLNVLPDGESVGGDEFQGAAPLDESSVPGGEGAVVGPPSIDVDEQRDMRLLYDAGGTARVIEGTGQGLSAALSLGPGFAGSEPAAASVMNPQGGGVSAWSSAEAQGHPAVAVREDFPDGAVQTGLLSGGAGGEVGELAVGRSGLGDGLIGFRQGPFGDAAIVAARTTAPPQPFLFSIPKGWVRPAQARVSWQPALSGDGPLSYRVVLDGRVLRTPAGSSMRLSPRGLSSGRHRVQVLATDRDGQSTLSAPASLKVAATPPSVRISRAGGSTVRVLVLDRYDGVEARAVRISFGDGSSARARRRFVHRYAHPGVYRVTVLVGDRIGNRGIVRELVSVR